MYFGFGTIDLASWVSDLNLLMARNFGFWGHEGCGTIVTFLGTGVWRGLLGGGAGRGAGRKVGGGGGNTSGPNTDESGGTVGRS